MMYLDASAYDGASSARGIAASDLMKTPWLVRVANKNHENTKGVGVRVEHVAHHHH